MPELPEVESIKKIVLPVFIGQKLNKYSINDERTNRFNSENPKNLGILLGVFRKGKVLDFTFKDYSILFKSMLNMFSMFKSCFLMISFIFPLDTS